MSARSRAFPWWGERRLPEPFVRHEWTLAELLVPEPPPIHVAFDRAGAGFRVAERYVGQHQGRPVFETSRTEWDDAGNETVFPPARYAVE